MILEVSGIGWSRVSFVILELVSLLIPIFDLDLRLPAVSFQFFFVNPKPRVSLGRDCLMNPSLPYSLQRSLTAYFEQSFSNPPPWWVMSMKPNSTNWLIDLQNVERTILNVSSASAYGKTISPLLAMSHRPFRPSCTIFRRDKNSNRTNIELADNFLNAGDRCILLSVTIVPLLDFLLMFGIRYFSLSSLSVRSLVRWFQTRE